MKRIQLGKMAWVYTGLVAIVDDEDYDELSKHGWFAMPYPTKETFYAARSVEKGNKRHTTVMMHREIIDVPDQMVIVHKNGDGLDNRKDNLRLATRAEIQMKGKR
jgi:hypothetical protein